MVNAIATDERIARDLTGGVDARDAARAAAQRAQVGDTVGNRVRIDADGEDDESQHCGQRDAKFV